MYPGGSGSGMLAVVGIGLIVGQNFIGGAVLTAFAVALFVLALALGLAAGANRRSR